MMRFSLPFSFLLLLQIRAVVAVNQTRDVYISHSGPVNMEGSAKLKYNFVMINGGSSFFEPAKIGFENTCREMGTSCQYFQRGSPCHDYQNEVLRELKELHLNGTSLIDGIAIVPCKPVEVGPVMREVVEATGIPIVTYDTDIPDSLRSAYVGTDNRFLGQTMANVLKQLQPEGGTFVIISDRGKSNLEARAAGFREEITRDNEREGKARWNEAELSPVAGVGSTIFLAQPAADQNPTAIVTMFQSPMRSVNWTDFVDFNRHRNITIVGSDGSDYQIDYLNRGYVDGLVGQLPYDMGRVASEVLYERTSTGRLQKDFYATNLVSYTLIPLDLPELTLDQNLLGNLVYVGYTCYTIVVISAFACMSWTMYRRKCIVVRAAQPFFLFMVASGILLLSSALVPLSFDDGGDPDSMSQARSIGICMGIPWLAFIGFTVTFSALFSKAWRVNRLFKSKVRHARIQVSEKDVLAPFAALLTCNIVVLIFWTYFDPLTYTREEHDGTDYWNRVISTYGACRSDNIVPYLTPLAVINLSVVAIACWQAFQARDIKSEFSEAKYVGLTVSSLFQALLTGLPILIIVKDTPEAFYLVTTLLIFVLCMVALLLIFLPKVFMQKEYSGMSDAEQKRVMSEGIRQSSGAFQHSSLSNRDLALSNRNMAVTGPGDFRVVGSVHFASPGPIAIDHLEAEAEPPLSMIAELGTGMGSASDGHTQSSASDERAGAAAAAVVALMDALPEGESAHMQTLAQESRIADTVSEDKGVLRNAESEGTVHC